MTSDRAVRPHHLLLLAAVALSATVFAHPSIGVAAGSLAGLVVNFTLSRRFVFGASAVQRRLDWVLIGSVAALVAYGLWAIADITRHDVTGNPDYYMTRQAVYAAIGVLWMVMAAANAENR